ncbi:MAG: hypothetical protein LBN40_00815 [Oscillospiraceae bacterium]|jgi:hypothetical protein|nr:hypothetical protein [Oscillospiraceae bacterium]
MTVKELLERTDKFVIEVGGDFTREISRVYVCDLLSFAMGKAPADGAWVTVMGNVNAVAVASLTDTAVIVLAENVHIDNIGRVKAEMGNINVLRTELGAFEASLLIHTLITS